MPSYKGYQLIKRYDRTQSRYLIVGIDGWTVARANTIKEAKAEINKLLKGKAYNQ